MNNGFIVVRIIFILKMKHYLTISQHSSFFKGIGRLAKSLFGKVKKNLPLLNIKALRIFQITN